MKFKHIEKTIAISSLLFMVTTGITYGQSIDSVFNNLSVFTDQLIEKQKDNTSTSSILSEVVNTGKVPVDLIGEPQMFLINTLLQEQLGKPYRYGASGPDEFDCSGLIYYVYGLAGKSVPRTSQAQGAGGEKVERQNLKFGDLVFFDTRNTENPKDITIDTSDTLALFTDETESPAPKEEFSPKVITHSGIYIGQGNFIHASSGNIMKVVVEKLDSKYFDQRYIFAKRY